MSVNLLIKPKKKRNFKALALTDSPVKPPPKGVAAGKPPAAQLEIGIEFQLHLCPDDFMEISKLGTGNGGTVSKVRHIRTNTVMARKIIPLQIKPEQQKQIMREMKYMHECNSEHIVSFYGAFMHDDNISICMEYMEAGSLDSIYKKCGPIPLPELRMVAYAIVDGLAYLYEVHRIIHRDLKPSNVLVNWKGQIKLCDFGVSGELINSIADTFVGTSYYMSPERIMGTPYSVKSDVWSLGVMIMELALGSLPFTREGEALSIFELLQAIVHEPAPEFPPNRYPPDLTDFVHRCLVKDLNARPTPSDLRNHVYLQHQEKVDLEGWARNLQPKNDMMDMDDAEDVD